MRQQLISTKISGSTLIEVLVAMVIIGGVFAIGAMTYTNVINAELGQRRVVARYVLGTEMADLMATKDLEPGSWKSNGISLTKKVKTSAQNPLVSVVELVASDQQGLELGRIKQMVLHD